jgi:predicted transposase YbfD/YdcC
MPLSERSDVEDHAQDRGEPDQQQHDGGNQGERYGIGAFSVNEARRFHGVPRMAKAEHKLHVVDDAADQHEDAEDDERDAEVARGAGVRDRACVTKL